MSITCPNCGSGGRWLIVSSDNDGMVCSECGTMYWPSGEYKVPRRSQPVEPLELPNKSGYWWMGDGTEWMLARFFIDPEGRAWWADAGVRAISRQYVRCVLPIVDKPKPKRDGDASRPGWKARRSMIEENKQPPGIEMVEEVYRSARPDSSYQGMLYRCQDELADLRRQLAIATAALKTYAQLERLSFAIGSNQELPDLTIARDALYAMKGGA